MDRRSPSSSYEYPLAVPVMRKPSSGMELTCVIVLGHARKTRLPSIAGEFTFPWRDAYAVLSAAFA